MTTTLIMTTKFHQQVAAVVKTIPPGSVMTYAEVANAAGSPGAARAVGTIMKANFDPEIPCHRVIRSDRRVGEYNRGGSAEKLKKLEKEGVETKNGKVIID